jgi:peptidoglycan/LPS O-acetylase OafA/YrhL
METAYRRDIEGLRALAVLSVIAYHAFSAVAPGGFVGVDVFFVISGFLITGIIVRERDAGAFSWGRFYLRRARRILPAFLAVTLTVAALAAWIELPQQLRTTGGVLGFSGLFTANLAFGRTPGYFDPVPQQSPLLHLWSLGVEEQFYLLWPALIALLWLKPLKRARPWLALVLAVLSLAFAQKQLTAGAFSQAFFGLAPRVWEFLAGGLLLFGVPSPNRRRLADLASGAGLVLILGSVVLLNDRVPFPGLAALPACLGAALLIWAGQGQSPRPSALLESAPARAVGRISYSLYLWHWPLLVLAREVAQRPLALYERALLMAIAGGLAVLSWRFVEQPFRRGETVRPWRRLAPFVAAPIVVFAAGAVLFFGQGLPGRLSPEARQAAAIETTDINPLRMTCFDHLGPLPPTGCRFGAADTASDYDVLVWGDSHADAVTPGVVEWARRRGLSVREATQGGCAPFTDGRLPMFPPVARDCRATTAEVVREIAADPKLKLVVLAARWPLYRDAPPFYDINSPRISASLRPQVNDLAPSLVSTLDTIASKTKARVVIIGPVPELTVIPPECEALRRHLHLPETVCWRVPAGPPLARARPAEAEIRQALAARPNTRAAFPSQDLCDAQTCVSALDGRLIYFDDDHLSASGARKLVPGWLDRALAGQVSALADAVPQAKQRPTPPAPSDRAARTFPAPASPAALPDASLRRASPRDG